MTSDPKIDRVTIIRNVKKKIEKYSKSIKKIVLLVSLNVIDKKKFLKYFTKIIIYF